MMNWIRRISSLCLFLLPPTDALAESVGDLFTDYRLNQRVSVQSSGLPLHVVLGELSRSSRVELAASPEIARERLFIYAGSEKLATLMTAMSRLPRWDWTPRTRADGAKYYVLYKPKETADREARLQREWRKGHEALELARHGQMMELMDRGLELVGVDPREREDTVREDPWLASAFHSQGDALFGLLSGLSPEERDALAESSLQPVGVISATNLSHIRDTIQLSTPFEFLSPSQQTSLREYAGSGGGPADLNGTEVGLASSGGLVGIAFTRGNEVFWRGGGLGAPKFPEIREREKARYRAAVAGENPINDDPNETNRVLAEKYGVEIPPDRATVNVRLLRSLADRIVRFDRVKDRFRIGSFLKTIHEQTGLTIIADALQRTSRVKHPWSLKDKASWSLLSAMKELAFQFRREVSSNDGLLMVRSRHYAVDRLFEVDDEVVTTLMEKRMKSTRLSFTDLVDMFRQLTIEQLEGLENTPKDTRALQSEASTIRRYYPAFKLWASLDEVSRQMARDEGLPLDRLTPAQAKDFWRSFSRGILLPPPAAGKPGIHVSVNDSRCVLTLRGPKVSGSTRTLSIPL